MIYYCGEMEQSPNENRIRRCDEGAGLTLKKGLNRTKRWDGLDVFRHPQQCAVSNRKGEAMSFQYNTVIICLYTNAPSWSSLDKSPLTHDMFKALMMPPGL